MGTDARYDALGVRHGATETEIRQAFRRRALETHPDRGGDRAAFEAVLDAARALLGTPAVAPSPPVPAPVPVPVAVRRVVAGHGYDRLLRGLDAAADPDPGVLQAIRRVRRADRFGHPGAVPGSPFTSFDDVLDRVHRVRCAA